MKRMIYRKAPVHILVQEPSNPSREMDIHPPTHRRIFAFPLILMVIGALLVGSVAGPIAAYFLFTSPALRANAPLVSPLSDEGDPLAFQYRVPFGQTAVQAAPQVYKSLDYWNPSSWFPTAEYPTLQHTPQFYTLTIPTIGIERAVVEIGGEDLKTSLIHYPGTALPGELGAPVIFGHSILRIFYNPKNYLSIFSTIMTLQTGDPMIVSYDGVLYTYRVVEKFEVKPSNIQILRQKYNGRYLKLVTCTPEGTYLRRGIVVGQLET